MIRTPGEDHIVVSTQRPQRAWIACLAAIVASLAAHANAAPSNSGVTTEAQVLAKRVWRTVITSCGGSAYFGKGGGKLVMEIQNPEFQLVKEYLSESDKANGYEYRGTALVVAHLFRMKSWSSGYGSEQGHWDAWTQWHESDDEIVEVGRMSDPHGLMTVPHVVLRLSMNKKDGKWLLLYPEMPPFSPTETLDISAVVERPFSTTPRGDDGETLPPSCSDVTAINVPVAAMTQEEDDEAVARTRNAMRARQTGLPH